MKKEIKKSYKKFNLDRIEHWQTIRLIEAIMGNDNDQAMINYTINAFRTEDWVDPQPIEELIPKFIELFKEGHEILYMSKSFFGDEGGELLLVYLLKKEYSQKYWADFDIEVNCDNPKNPGFLHAPTYIANNPNEFIEIWAGAY